MIIGNPRYYTYEEMEKEFDGLCVCVAEPKHAKRGGRLIGGLVIVYDPIMDVVVDETKILREVGMYPEPWSYEDFTYLEIIETGVVDVVSLEG